MISRPRDIEGWQAASRRRDDLEAVSYGLCFLTPAALGAAWSAGSWAAGVGVLAIVFGVWRAWGGRWRRVQDDLSRAWR